MKRESVDLSGIYGSVSYNPLKWCLYLIEFV